RQNTTLKSAFLLTSRRNPDVFPFQLKSDSGRVTSSGGGCSKLADGLRLALNRRRICSLRNGVDEEEWRMGECAGMWRSFSEQQFIDKCGYLEVCWNEVRAHESV
ncbi:hypothetical protein AVEN_145922-1, partial [Araneus ventricosus]